MGDGTLTSDLSQACGSLIDSGMLQVWDDDRSITSWDKLTNTANILSLNSKTSWLFRAEGDWRKDPKTSIEKDAEQFEIPLEELYRGRIEQGLIRRFKREYQKYVSAVPDDDDYIGWLSIMQHHGAPTRLLDITYSIFVAVYFALWKYKPNDTVALWCFNNNWLDDGWAEIAPKGYLREYARDRQGRHIRLFEIVLKHTQPKVYHINPYHLPERLVLQQAGFLLPLDVTQTFVDNLASMPVDPRRRTGEVQLKQRVIKIRIHLDPGNLKRVQYGLMRMNINSATLFPGIDGFARSLRDRLPFEEQRMGLREGF